MKTTKQEFKTMILQEIKRIEKLDITFNQFNRDVLKPLSKYFDTFKIGKIPKIKYYDDLKKLSSTRFKKRFLSNVWLSLREAYEKYDLKNHYLKRFNSLLDYAADNDISKQLCNKLIVKLSNFNDRIYADYRNDICDLFQFINEWLAVNDEYIADGTIDSIIGWELKDIRDYAKTIIENNYNAFIF